MSQLDRIEQKLDRLLTLLDTAETKKIPQKRPQKRLPLEVEDRFEEFWQIYPQKVKKQESHSLWMQKKLDEKLDVLITDVQNRIENDGDLF